jgi:hypothetical protein
MEIQHRYSASANGERKVPSEQKQADGSVG